MIRRCIDSDFDAIHIIINDGARAYEGVIPVDRWREPYMSKEKLWQEIHEIVIFWGYEENDQLIGIMGIQDVKGVSLIRHAYVRTAKRNQGIGGRLLFHLRSQTARPLLVGTWADAIWAIRFYEKRGFRQVNKKTKDRLLKEYWSIPKRQIDTSVVLADEKWFETQTQTHPTKLHKQENNRSTNVASIR